MFPAACLRGFRWLVRFRPLVFNFCQELLIYFTEINNIGRLRGPAGEREPYNP